MAGTCKNVGLLNVILYLMRKSSMLGFDVLLQSKTLQRSHGGYTQAINGVSEHFCVTKLFYFIWTCRNTVYLQHITWCVHKL